MSQHIATDQFDPTREDWQYQLRQMAAPEFREDDDDIPPHSFLNRIPVPNFFGNFEGVDFLIIFHCQY